MFIIIIITYQCFLVLLRTPVVYIHARAWFKAAKVIVANDNPYPQTGHLVN